MQSFLSPATLLRAVFILLDGCRGHKLVSLFGEGYEIGNSLPARPEQ